MTSNALEAAAPNVSDHLLSAQTVENKKTRYDIPLTEIRPNYKNNSRNFYLYYCGTFELKSK